MSIEDLNTIDELIAWIQSHAVETKVSDYVTGFTHGVVERLTNAGAKKVEFKFMLNETRLNGGKLAGYLLLLSVLVDSNPEPDRTIAVYYLVNDDDKIVGYLTLPHA